MNAAAKPKMLLTAGLLLKASRYGIRAITTAPKISICSDRQKLTIRQNATNPKPNNQAQSICPTIPAV